MSEGFNVHLGELRQHAATVGQMSNQVSQACKVAQAMLSGNAYGVVGAFFVAAIMSASGEVGDALMKGAKSFMDVQKGLKDVADLYQQVDQARAELFKLSGTEGAR